jgi:hypothetical protein
VLGGRWQLVRERDGKEEFVGVKEAAITERVDGGDDQALVAALQRALVRFGLDLLTGSRSRRQSECAVNPDEGSILQLEAHPFGGALA